jgi:hypothetical protein
MPTVLELYEKLKPKLGEEEARALLEFVKASVERRAATKEDLQRTELALREELHRLDQALREELRGINQALREELRGVDQALREELRRIDQALREELHSMEQTLREDLRLMDQTFRGEIHRIDQKIEVTKADLIKWTFGFWIGNVAVTSGIMFALIRAFAGK